MEKDTKKLFQITEAAHACGLSRSTLMRMEKKGLLTPAYIAAESGRRYYDNHDVARILQIEKFKSMGLTTEQIADYFAQGGEISTLLATVADKYADMYDFYSECVRQGCVLSEEPLFTISDRQDYLEGYISSEPYPYTVCVPVQPEKAPADALVLPECRVLSVLYCGDYSGVDEAWLTLGREVKARGLTLAGNPRVLGIVAPCTGREIESRRYCSRFVLPVME